MQYHNYFYFKIVKYFIQWQNVRLIWIAFYQNTNNENCFISRLCKDIVQHILSLLGTIVDDTSDERTPLINDLKCVLLR